VLSNVSLYRAGDAKSILSERQRIYRDAVDCSVNDPDETYTAHWEAMTAPSLGDDAAAWRIHVTTEGDRPPDADWYVILIRRGQSIASIALYRERYLLGDPGATPIEFAQIAQRADERLASIQDALTGD
jgi:hypothetical protein